MKRELTGLLLAGVATSLLCAGSARATTRELAEFRSTTLSFESSVLNQLTFDVYRDPYDELQGRPYNLLFTNIGRHPNLSPWQGQEGRYTRFVNALIGNNGRSNIDNDADAIQGSMILRQTPRLSWGVSAAYLAGSDESDDLSGTTTFRDVDEVTGAEARFAAAWQLSTSRVLGGGVRFGSANREMSELSFEPGVGGFFGTDEFQQTSVAFDLGMRSFLGNRSSWEIQVVGGVGDAEVDELSDSLDDTGTITDRFVATDYDVSETRIGLQAGYNRLRRDRLGETEFRLGVEQSSRELDNTDLSYQDTGGTITQNLTLLAQDAVETMRISFAAKTIFQAGETEMFAAARLSHASTDGATQIDQGGTPINEAIDDTSLNLGLTLGVRQPLFRDKLRFVVSGHADYLSSETTTAFDVGIDSDDSTLSTAQYAVGFEGVLANTTFDVAWLFGEASPVVPVGIGLPAGSRRTVDLDTLVFSAAVSW